MQASTIKMQAYNMEMELVSNANLVVEAIDLVERYRNANLYGAWFSKGCSHTPSTNKL
jgi:hypothetical protein